MADLLYFMRIKMFDNAKKNLYDNVNHLTKTIEGIFYDSNL